MVWTDSSILSTSVPGYLVGGAVVVGLLGRRQAAVTVLVCWGKHRQLNGRVEGHIFPSSSGKMQWTGGLILVAWLQRETKVIPSC